MERMNNSNYLKEKKCIYVYMYIYCYLVSEHFKKRRKKNKNNNNNGILERIIKSMNSFH